MQGSWVELLLLGGVQSKSIYIGLLIVFLSPFFPGFMCLVLWLALVLGYMRSCTFAVTFMFYALLRYYPARRTACDLDGLDLKD